VVRGTCSDESWTALPSAVEAHRKSLSGSCRRWLSCVLLAWCAPQWWADRQRQWVKSGAWMCEELATVKAASAVGRSIRAIARNALARVEGTIGNDEGAAESKCIFQADLAIENIHYR
jgi:hypothetical protein